MYCWRKTVKALYIFLCLWNVAYGESCLDLFKAMVDRGSKVNYQLNLDRAYARIESWRTRFANELHISTAFNYDGHDVYRIDMPSRSASPKGRIIITAGVHGNESIGTASLIELIEELVQRSGFRNDYDFVFFPALNPGGLEANSRYLSNGVDMNRTFKPGSEDRITNLLKESLQGERFDLALDMHEAYKKNGFFVIKAQDTDKEYIESVMSAVPSDYIFKSPDGKYPYNVPNTKNPSLTSYVLSSPGITASFNGGTVKSFFRDDLGATHSYTLESGGQIELGLRKEIYKSLVLSFIEKF